MARYKLVVAYDGGAYLGFQIQNQGPSIQEELEKAASYLACEHVRVNGSGRTDAGVHARGQVVHFDCAKPIPPESMVRAMNTRLPEDIRILSAAIVPESFDARRSAHGKEYRYFLYNAPILPPVLRPFWAWDHKPLDENAMAAGAEFFCGNHDFAPFSANPHRELFTTVRYISSFTVRRSGPKITFAVRGDGFLYKQVRSMVGYLMRVGRGAETPESVAEILEEAGPRTARVPTAPGRGLFLWKVFYPAACLRMPRGNGKTAEVCK